MKVKQSRQLGCTRALRGKTRHNACSTNPLHGRARGLRFLLDFSIYQFLAPNGQCIRYQVSSSGRSGHMLRRWKKCGEKQNRLEAAGHTGERAVVQRRCQSRALHGRSVPAWQPSSQRSPPASWAVVGSGVGMMALCCVVLCGVRCLSCVHSTAGICGLEVYHFFKFLAVYIRSRSSITRAECLPTTNILHREGYCTWGCASGFRRAVCCCRSGVPSAGVLKWVSLLASLGAIRTSIQDKLL